MCLKLHGKTLEDQTRAKLVAGLNKSDRGLKDQRLIYRLHSSGTKRTNKCEMNLTKGRGTSTPAYTLCVSYSHSFYLLHTRTFLLSVVLTRHFTLAHTQTPIKVAGSSSGREDGSSGGGREWMKAGVRREKKILSGGEGGQTARSLTRIASPRRRG